LRRSRIPLAVLRASKSMIMLSTSEAAISLPDRSTLVRTVPPIQAVVTLASVKLIEDRLVAPDAVIVSRYGRPVAHSDVYQVGWASARF